MQKNRSKLESTLSRVRQALLRKAKAIAASVAITLIFATHAAGYIALPGLQTLERQLYDVRVRATATYAKDDRITILDIDEKSLKEFGRWPWNRVRIATIVQQLFEKYGVAAVGFDIVWAESETDQLLSLQQDLASQGAASGNLLVPDTDTYLAQTLTGKPVILGYYFNNGDVAANALPQPVLTLKDLPANTSLAPDWRGYTGNIQPLVESAAGAGQINAIPDDDGVIRRVPLLMRHGDGYYEGLSLAMIRILFGGMPVEPQIGVAEGYKRVEALKVGPLTLPVDRELASHVTYRGPQRTFDYVSLGDVLAGRVEASRLSGRLVLIGTSAPGLSDIRSTPTDPIMPGVEVHASMISAALDQQIRQQPAYATGLDIALVLVVGLLASLLLPLIGALAGTALVAALSGGVIWLNMTLWRDALMITPLATATMVLAALYLFNMAWGFLIEGRSKRQLGSMFGQYVPPSLVKEMARDPERYTMENKDAELTVLFADVRGFTTISEALSAKELAAYINEYLTRMSAIIAGGKGTLDKFIGDAIMAFWGAPLDDEDHARNAVFVAMEMRDEQRRLTADFAQKGWPAIDIGIGLNSGPMRVGNMGSKHRLAYTVMGDAVNLGSRLEGLTKNYGVGIIIGEATRARVPDIACRLLDRVQVKGKNKAVEIFEPLCLEQDLTTHQQDELRTWHQMMDAYFAQRWDDANAALARTETLGSPTFLVGLFKDRIAEMRMMSLPDDWDGVTAFKTK